MRPGDTSMIEEDGKLYVGKIKHITYAIEYADDEKNCRYVTTRTHDELMGSKQPGDGK